MAKGKPTDPLDPVFLIEHAERLTTSEGGGRPPTIDSRRADYDRVQPVSRAAAQNLLAQAKAVLGFFESGRVDDADTRAFFALVALKA